jgi:hypothetical protein
VSDEEKQFYKFDTRSASVKNFLSFFNSLDVDSADDDTVSVGKLSGL